MIWTGDLFELYRRLLLIALAVYGLLRLVRMVETAGGMLLSRRREIVLLRQYVAVQVLRLRLRRFWRDWLEISGLLVVVGFLGWLHAKLVF